MQEVNQVSGGSGDVLRCRALAVNLRRLIFVSIYYIVVLRSIVLVGAIPGHLIFGMRNIIMAAIATSTPSTALPSGPRDTIPHRLQ